jgi:hypothetical protein
MIGKLVVTNQLFYWQKTLLVTFLCGFLLFTAAVSCIFTAKVKELATKPLASLETEIILQQDRSDKAPQNVKTKGNILPFNLKSFQRDPVLSWLKNMDDVRAVSTALVFWQFGLENTITAIGLSKNDPVIGIRRISSMLMPGGRFFKSDSAKEVILERHFSKLFGYKLGGKYSISGTEYLIVGIVDFQEKSNLSNAQVFMPYETAVKALGITSGQVNQIYVSLKQALSLERVKTEITESFPAFSLITKDKLLANLSNLNRIFYRFGEYLAAGILLIVALLVIWIFIMYRLEYKEQIEIFRLLGWPKKNKRRFVAVDIIFILFYAGIVTGVLTCVFYLLVVPGMRFESLMQQGFKL